MSIKQLNNLRELAGLTAVSESTEGTGVVDVTPAVQAVESPEKKVPADIRTALQHAIQQNAQEAQDLADKGDAGTMRFKNTVATFAMELDNMLDDSEEGFKRAGEHLHSALNSIVHLIPDAVVKYLSGNVVADLNKEEINKEGIRKHLSAYVDDLRS